jgi:hypothetical protein
VLSALTTALDLLLTRSHSSWPSARVHGS